MQTARLVLGLLSVGLIMGALLGVAGNVWVEFYLKYLSAQYWMLDLSSSLVTLALIALCVFLAGMQLSPRAETLDTEGAVKLRPDLRVNIPPKFADQLNIGPGDRLTVTVDQDRLVIQKRG